MDEYLFIDGPHDGKRIYVSPYVPEVRLVHDESFVYYRKASLSEAGKIFEVFVWKDSSRYLLEMLIKGYKLNSEREANK